MKNKTLALLTIVCFISVSLVQFSCDKKVGKNLITPVVNTPETVSACDTITYNKHIKPIITKSCASVPQCHTAGFESGNITLDLLVDVKNNAKQIKETVFDGNPKIMPPVDDTVTLSIEAKKLLNCWLNNGMKN